MILVAKAEPPGGVTEIFPLAVTMAMGVAIQITSEPFSSIASLPRFLEPGVASSLNPLHSETLSGLKAGLGYFLRAMSVRTYITTLHTDIWRMEVFTT